MHTHKNPPPCPIKTIFSRFPDLPEIPVFSVLFSTGPHHTHTRTRTLLNFLEENLGFGTGGGGWVGSGGPGVPAGRARRLYDGRAGRAGRAVGPGMWAGPDGLGRTGWAGGPGGRAGWEG